MRSWPRPQRAIDSKKRRSMTGETSGKIIWNKNMLGIAIQPRVPYLGLPTASRCFRNFGAADGVFVVKNFPTLTANGEGQVGILGDGVTGKTVMVAQHAGAPG